MVDGETAFPTAADLMTAARTAYGAERAAALTPMLSRTAAAIVALRAYPLMPETRPALEPLFAVEDPERGVTA